MLSHRCRIVTNAQLPQQSAFSFVKYQNIEEAVIDNLLDDFRDSVEQPVEFEDRDNFGAELVQNILKLYSSPAALSSQKRPKRGCRSSRKNLKRFLCFLRELLVSHYF